MDRYGRDVLDPRTQRAARPRTVDVPMEIGMVVEDPASGYVGEIMGWENGLVILEDRHGKRRAFPVGPGFWLDGKPVALRIPPRTGSTTRYTASGSRVGDPGRPAKVALPSRIYVEGRHDAELVEKIWGSDLRHVGVVVEYLGGIDDLVSIVAEFRPEKGRRLGVLVDHLVSGTKEQRIAAEVARGGYGDVVRIAGHRFIDIWQAIRPEVLGIKAWPEVPRDVDFKKGTLAALGMPHHDQIDIANAWKAMLGRVRTFRDLDPDFTREVEKLIDFVTQDHLDEID
ncbi:DUF3097 domain-containing protein [Brooklawnia cerclae]|nr:DUF3097 family protein [Brooklawnia cerclae]